MKLKLYFLILVLMLSTKFMNIHFFSVLPYDFINLFISLFFIGYSFFNINSWSLKNFKNTTFFIKTFFIAYLLSSITAYVDWGQGFITTFIASRFVLWLSFGLYLIKSKTDPKVLYDAFYKFTWIYVILSVFINVFPDTKHLFLYYDVEFAYRLEGAFFAGIQFVLIPLYVIIERFIGKQFVSKKDYLLLILSIVTIFFTENRATLFTVLFLIFISYILYSKINIFKKTLITGSITLLFVVFIFEEINPLIEETIIQLNDFDYPRIRAVLYFINDFSNSNLGYLLGNSFGSKKEYYGQFLDSLKTEKGIYVSDLGLFGTWVYFGVLGLIAILFPVYNMIFRNKDFKAFKLLSLNMIVGFTMFLFLPEYTFVFFISILYLFDYKNIVLNKTVKSINSVLK